MDHDHVFLCIPSDFPLTTRKHSECEYRISRLLNVNNDEGKGGNRRQNIDSFSRDVNGDVQN